MTGRILDWIDWFTGYDRTGARVLLFIVAINAVIFGIVAYDLWLKPPACDTACEAAVEHFFETNPQFGQPLPTPDGEELIREVIGPTLQ